MTLAKDRGLVADTASIGSIEHDALYTPRFCRAPVLQWLALLADLMLALRDTMANSIISVDSGSSWMKGYDGNRCIHFEAVVQPVDAGTEGAIEVEGESYLVGREALLWQKDADQKPNTDYDYHGGMLQYIQLCELLRQLGLSSGRQDGLVLSLPYAASTEANTLARIQRHQVVAWRDARGEHRVIFSGVRVCAQGVGALREFQRHATRHEELRQVLLVDIGSLTTDIVAVRRQSATDGWAFVREGCTTWQDISTTVLFETWVDHMNGLPGLGRYPWRYFPLMEKAMLGDLCWPHMGVRISLTKSFVDARRIFAGELWAKLREWCGTALWSQLDRILLTGGGAALLGQAQRFDKRAHVMDIWANVVGQYHHTAGG